MIDAACQAIRSATGIDGTLTDFNVSSVTGGVDALGDVVIQFESDGIKVVGPRRLDRRGRGVGPGLPQRHQQGVRIAERAEVRDTVTGP